MVVWGDRPFMNDRDIDHIEQLAIEFGLESLYSPDCPPLVKDELERDSNLDQKLSDILSGKESPKGPGKEYTFGLLVAAAMSVGAKISREHLAQLGAWLAQGNCGFTDEGRLTLIDALRVYNPEIGLRLVVAGPELAESVELKMEHEEIRLKKELGGPVPRTVYVGPTVSLPAL